MLMIIPWILHARPLLPIPVIFQACHSYIYERALPSRSQTPRPILTSDYSIKALQIHKILYQALLISSSIEVLRSINEREVYSRNVLWFSGFSNTAVGLSSLISQRRKILLPHDLSLTLASFPPSYLQRIYKEGTLLCLLYNGLVLLWITNTESY